MDTYKIDWLKIVKRLSPYNIKKGLALYEAFWTEGVLDSVDGTLSGRRCGL